jgi:ATP-dependent exoDNAse (exonuclease V) beta subunit
VFWDPKALELDKEDEAGLRHERVLANGPAAKRSEDEHAAWTSRRNDVIAGASAPTLRVRTVTEMKDDAGAVKGSPAEAVAVESTDATRRARPHGKRFGVLVHAVLATVALDAEEGAIADASRIQGRVTGASEEEIAAVRDVVGAALTHPLLVRARNAERLEREVAVMVREDDGSIVEGVVDLAFFEKDAGWTVVDFKTDLAMGERREAYVKQVALYARAIAVATGAPAKGALLSV